jgi:eukaryotic-like serine/threonine-protein kinase
MNSSLIRRCAVCGYRFDVTQDVCPLDQQILPAPDPAVADLGSFRLIERLGDGGMGAVYLAVHRRLGRPVAIKLLHRDLTSDRGLVGRFFHEARAASTIRHEHVVEVYDFVEAGEDVYFVMEHLKGQDLHDAIHRNARGSAGMDPGRAVAILEQICAALHATHARAIVHRDLKPENVFLSEKNGAPDFVKVFDFGVAKLDRPDGRATIEGAILGTPEYMAPEQASGAPVDGRADIYSLGCIAYEMLTQRQVFGGGAQKDILLRQMTVTPPPLRTHVPTIPPALDAVVMSALAKDPARRPQTALAFAEALAGALGRGLESSAAFRTVSRTTPPSLTNTPTFLSSLVVQPVRWHQAMRPLWRPLTLGAAVITLLSGAVVAGKLARSTKSAKSAKIAKTAKAESRSSAPSSVTVLLQSVPSGAEILDEGATRIGLTPYDLVVPAGGVRQVRFQKAGFRTVDRRFQLLTDTTIAVSLDPEPQDDAERNRAARGRKGSVARLNAAATIDPFGRSAPGDE